MMLRFPSCTSSLRELATLVCASKQFTLAASKLSMLDWCTRTSQRCDDSPNGHAPPALPHPRSAFRRFVTQINLTCCSPQLLSACGPFTLRERCPALRWLELQFVQRGGV